MGSSARVDPTFASWAAQVRQYPPIGRPGISYLEGRPVSFPEYRVDCLRFRNQKGGLIGILNHYPIELLSHDRAHNINIWVRPDRQRRGVGTRLVTAALRRWPEIELDMQEYTPAGLALAQSLVGLTPLAADRSDGLEPG